jgi:hypothetical protein
MYITAAILRALLALATPRREALDAQAAATLMQPVAAKSAQAFTLIAAADAACSAPTHPKSSAGPRASSRSSPGHAAAFP